MGRLQLHAEEEYEAKEVRSVFIAGCLAMSLCSGFFWLASSADVSAIGLLISEYIERSGRAL